MIVSRTGQGSTGWPAMTIPSDVRATSIPATNTARPEAALRGKLDRFSQAQDDACDCAGVLITNCMVRTQAKLKQEGKVIGRRETRSTEA